MKLHSPLRLLVAIGWIFLAFAPLFAQEAALRQVVPARYLNAPVDELLAALPPPPQPGSPASETDLDAVLQVQWWRTQEQVQWARKVAIGGPFDFADILGSWFSASNLPRLASLFQQLDAEIHPFSSQIKRHFQRPRPPQVDPRIQTVVELPRSSSYPSGHTLYLYLEAGVLGEVFPERRQELFDRARRAAWGRVIGGVHFPTDLVGGRLLAEALISRLLQNAGFRDQLALCRLEAAPFLPSVPKKPAANPANSREKGDPAAAAP